MVFIERWWSLNKPWGIEAHLLSRNWLLCRQRRLAGVADEEEVDEGAAEGGDPFKPIQVKIHTQWGLQWRD